MIPALNSKTYEHTLKQYDVALQRAAQRIRELEAKLSRAEADLSEKNQEFEQLENKHTHLEAAYMFEIERRIKEETSKIS